MRLSTGVSFALTVALAVLATPPAMGEGNCQHGKPAEPAESTPSAEPEPSWCAPELEALPAEVCHFSRQPDDGSAPRVLVIYLHGVIKPGTKWQWTQERAMVRHAKAHGLTVLVPRGRRGIGPKDMRDWWTWPTSTRAQRQVEDELIDEWMKAKELLEKRSGRAFDKTYVFGFSNGAYYASALALRGRLEVDGYGVFAGGSGKYLRKQARSTKRRPPIYVGYGKKDRAWRDSYRFGATLRSLGWRYKMVGRRRVGHTMTDSMVAEALKLFGRYGAQQP